MSFGKTIGKIAGAVGGGLGGAVSGAIIAAKVIGTEKSGQALTAGLMGPNVGLVVGAALGYFAVDHFVD